MEQLNSRPSKKVWFYFPTSSTRMVDQTSLDRAATRPSKSYFQPRKSWWGRSPYDGNPRGRKGSL